MEIKQQLRLSQQLVMTPQLQQAIKLLQMSRMELVDLVHEEMLENPMLEDVLDRLSDDSDSRTDSASDGGESASANGEAGEPPDAEQSSSPADVAVDEALGGDARALEAVPVDGSVDSGADGGPAEAKTDDIDWERYVENHALQAPLPTFRGGGDGDELPGIEATYSRGEDLTEHLLWQLQMSDFVEDERRFLALVIGNLTDDGYLRMEELLEDEVVPHLAREAGLDPEDAEEVLTDFQRFDPLGVGSRTLSECLLVQAKQQDLDDLVLTILRDHISSLEKRNYQAIAKKLDVSMEEVLDCAQVIAELEPRPGRNFLTEEPRYITPDVYVHRVGPDYFVQANDDGMPKLKISGYYRSAIVNNPQAKEYIQNKLRSAQWLIRSIEQRRKTIVRVTECIVEKQRDFFDKGIAHLKPMILRDVAEAVDMHESTISRVTSNKYVHTPRGLFELKYFFNSAIRRENQEDIASESVKQAIKKIVASEDPKSPYSDQKIVELLADKGVKIARRTVAKYREMLGILSSSKRKQYF